MDSCQITILVSTLANCIAKDLTNEEIALAAVVLTQLGDTLATIAAIEDCK